MQTFELRCAAHALLKRQEQMELLAFGHRVLLRELKARAPWLTRKDALQARFVLHLSAGANIPSVPRALSAA